MRIFFLSIALVLSITTQAQVRDIKSKIDEDKADDSAFATSYQAEPPSSSFDPPSFEEGLAHFLIGSLLYYTGYGIYIGLEHAQYGMQLRRPDHPETFSLEGQLNAGFDFPDDATIFSPSVRVNHGLFASDLRYLYTRDVTGNLQTIDWQVLKLRLPIKNLKLEYGIGFSHVLAPSKTYFEQSAGFDWCFFNRKVTLQGMYRWSQSNNVGVQYREEVNLSADYEATKIGRFRLCPSAGFVYQEYFESTQFRLITLGLKARLF